jgi:hypothetical protein
LFQVARKTSELLTRDADDPKIASGEDVLPPPQSKLWAAGAKAATSKANGIHTAVKAASKVAANGHGLTNGIANGH